MATRATPPATLPPPPDAVDDSWDALIDGAFTETPSPPVEPTEFDISERDTTIPTRPPEGMPEGSLEVEFGRPPAPIEELPPTRRIASEPSVPSVFSRRPSPDGVSLARRESDHPTPMSLVETYRHATGAIPHAQPLEADTTESSESEGGSVANMKDRYAVGDYTGALVLAESVLELSPEDEEAKRYAQSCREVLTQMYAARIGPMNQVAIVAVAAEQITWLSLDHRSGFLLSLIDGISSIEEILDIGGMTRLDALRIMFTLLQQNVITLDQRV